MHQGVKRPLVAVLAVLAVVSVVAILGCSDSDSGGQPAQTTGAVHGVIRDLQGRALGGINVTIGGITVTSDPNTGAFTVSGLAQGTYTITVTDPSGLTKVLGTLAQVTVVPPITTDISGTPIVMEPDGPPPNPPT